MQSIISGITPNEFALLVSVFAIAISDGLSAEETAALGAFITAVGDTVAMIGAQQALTAGNNASVKVYPGGT